MIKTLYNMWETLYNGMKDVYEWFLTDYELLGFSGQVYELVIGGGVIVVIAYIILNWLL